MRPIKHPNVQIIVLFGKNEGDVSKSMRQEDVDFFKQFPNTQIRYEKRLHAKYYSNEKKAILTSMNLYGFSQNNNIEAGVLMENSLKGTFTGGNELDQSAWEYFKTVLQQSELLFEKKPVYERKNIFSSYKYIKSDIVVDQLPTFFQKKNYKTPHKKKESIVLETKIEKDGGFCIRSGKKYPSMSKNQ